LTVIIGAKCSDGIVLIADRKLTRTNGQVFFSDKIIGDFKHFLMGYTGDVEMFDIFRRYTVGDATIERDTQKHYTLENLLSKVSKSIKRFNKLGGSQFKVLMCNHNGHISELYHIDEGGNPHKVLSRYKSIESGEDMADKFCRGLDFDKITMKEFTQHAYLAIMFMNQYCPALGEGL
jgi:20S proteasome alpha/beta subunit